jgi:pimeloyl-ACP methyl ester carboxylesterase
MKTTSTTTFHAEIEVITTAPVGPARPTPLLFVHGAFSGAWIWQEFYLPYFAAEGWACSALSLAGHGKSAGRERLDLIPLSEYVDNLCSVVATLPAPPVIIGHSMGGMVVQKYLEREDARAVVLMSSVPPTGLLASTTHLMMTQPALLVELNRALNGGVPEFDTLREALFAQPVAETELLKYFLLMQPESARAVWDMTWFDLPRLARMHRPPMLIVGAEDDRLVPASLVEQTARSFESEATIFPNTGHGMMLENHWQESARFIADWLRTQGF